MKKRILSLILSLSLVASLFTSVVNTAYAADTANEVLFEYYKDEALTDKITEVHPGDEFYMSVALNDFQGIMGFDIAVHYDSTKVELLDKNGNKVENDIVGGKGTNISSVIIEKVLSELKLGPITQDLLPINWNSNSYPVVSVDNEFVASARMASANCNKIQHGSALALKFRAKKNGNGGFCIATKALRGDKYTIAAGPNGILVGNKTEAISYDISKIEDITITTPGAKKLDAPANVTLTDRNASWDVVDGADKYVVKVMTTDANGTKDYEYDATSNSFVIPNEINGCDVKIQVKAVSNDSNVDESDYSAASNEVTLTKKLATPAAKWEGNKLIWDAVDGAASYTVVVTENATKEVYNQTVAGNEVALDSILKTPAEGVNVYVAKVTAIANTKYFENSDTATAEKKLLGSVKPAKNPVWNGTVAKWDASDDAANVKGYKVEVKDSNFNVIGTEIVTGTSVDLAKYIGNPGKYIFAVTALGKSDSVNGDYKDSVAAVSAINTVSETLKQVSNFVWTGRTLTWEDVNDSKNIKGYEVVIDKDGQSKKVTVINKLINLDDYNLTAAGTYKISVTVVGDGEIYKNSSAAETTKEFYQRIGKPQLVTLVNKKANWTMDPAEAAKAIGYEVELYYNRVKIADKTTGKNANELDWSDYIKFDGEYTCKVTALANEIDYSSSEAVESAPFINVETKKGSAAIKLYKSYENGVLSEEVTSSNKLTVGDLFYAAVTVNGTNAINGFNIPLAFDSKTVKVVDKNGQYADSKVVSQEEMITNAYVEKGSDFVAFDYNYNNNYPEIDNENGFINLTMMLNGEPKTVSANDEIVTVIRFKAYAKSSNSEFKFAKAGETRYDATSYGGLMMSGDGTQVYANIQEASAEIEKGKLPKMEAPVWNGEVITWNKAYGAEGYILYVYRDGVQIGEITIDNADTLTYSASGLIGSTRGSYTAKIVAVADGVSAENSDVSDASNAYVKGSSGGGGSAVIRPTQTPTPTPTPTPIPTPTPTETTKPELTDIDGHWAEDSIRRLVDKGIIEGYSDNTFRPDIGITRAEFTKLMVTALGLNTDEATETYEDTVNHWAKNFIAAGTKYGIVNGIGDNLFAPDVVITREQIAMIIYRIAGKPEVTAHEFADRDEISDYAKAAVDYVANNGIMIGFEGNVFKGTESSTRAQIATVVDRLLKNKFFEGKLNFENTDKNNGTAEDETSSAETVAPKSTKVPETTVTPKTAE